ncbi:DUF7315 family membrane protein [Natranaeroarchaeum aerophilus]|uniref:DUF7315 domain-containing protein n=1 Tax=Natranaeroarchaeum aerophilus TaxID=2917711 RepID=A0AAE3FU13_9EURY|nr:hypothetical protein [Natranaeroarchaeum aerophilus]MCL9814923.1 hypothetical protein [Natranaeroarchaeum aerophilus]
MADSNAPDDRASLQRDVLVPMEIYKVVTVFSMLIAIGLVVGGFLVLDSATDQATAETEDVNVITALLGIGLIAFGGVVYVFSTRFQPEAMGNAKDDTNQDTGNG